MILLSRRKKVKTHKGLLFVLAILMVAGFLGFRASEANQQEVISAIEDIASYAPDEVLVKLKATTPDTSIIKAIDDVQASVVTRDKNIVTSGLWAINKEVNGSFYGDPFLFRIRVAPSLGSEKAIQYLLASPDIEYSEKNYRGRLLTDYYPYQWALNNTGSLGGTVDADIDAPEAWSVFTGSSDMVIAIIDSGMAFYHDDLEPTAWFNLGETGDGKETDNIDNDGNGKVDDWLGWDFFNEDNNPTDDYGHGTHVAGIIGAEGSTNEGIKGVCWNSKLMVLKIANYEGDVYVSDAVAAIDYARLNGAKVINASWGFPYTLSLYQAIERAMASGVLVVAAAGNDSRNIDQYHYFYPAGYNLDNIICVAATDYGDQLSSFSNYGHYYVHLGAPGGTNTSQSVYNIISSITGGGYWYMRGTSMAAPHVSGAAALVLGQRPAIDWLQARTIILKSVDSLASLSGKTRTGGRLNLYSMITAQTPVLPDGAPTNLQYAVYENGDFFDIQLTWTDNSSNEAGFTVYMKSGGGYTSAGSVGSNTTTFWLYEAPEGAWEFFIRAYTSYSPSGGESVRSNIVSMMLGK